MGEAARGRARQIVDCTAAEVGHTYAVTAVDAAGNESVAARPLCVEMGSDNTRESGTSILEPGHSEEDDDPSSRPEL